MIATEIRSKRIQAGIPGYVLCLKAGIARTRLSDIERNYVVPSTEELSKLVAALGELILAKRKIEAVAAECGWPGEVR
jgi:transcriptional regulator with XRE-family HTH domain